MQEIRRLTHGVVKVLYSFDETKCLARSPQAREIRVINSDREWPLGIIDIQTCLDAVTTSSPEILSNLHAYDYAVYSVDFTEPEYPLVGHGMLSWLKLASGKNESKNHQPIFVVGQVCSNMMGVFSGGGSMETLEIKLRLKPISNNTQGQYLKSIQLYQRLSSFLPSDFNHPAWAAYFAQNPEPDLQPQRTKRPNEPEGMVLAKRQKTEPIINSTEASYDHEAYLFKHFSSPPISSPTLPQLYSDNLEYSSPSSEIRSDLTIPTPAPTSPITSPIEQDPMLTKRSLSTKQAMQTRSVDEKVEKVTARGTRHIPRTSSLVQAPKRTQKRNEAMCCENCGITQSQVWRRTKLDTDDKEVMLCNPCGLWYRNKKEMRPIHLFPSEKQKPKRVKNHQEPEEYSGPTIRDLLAFNRTNCTPSQLSSMVSPPSELITSSTSPPENSESKSNEQGEQKLANNRKAPAIKRSRKAPSATKSLTPIAPGLSLAAVEQSEEDKAYNTPQDNHFDGQSQTPTLDTTKIPTTDVMLTVPSVNIPNSEDREAEKLKKTMEIKQPQKSKIAVKRRAKKTGSDLKPGTPAISPITPSSCMSTDEQLDSNNQKTLVETKLTRKRKTPVGKRATKTASVEKSPKYVIPDCASSIDLELPSDDKENLDPKSNQFDFLFMSSPKRKNENAFDNTDIGTDSPSRWLSNFISSPSTSKGLNTSDDIFGSLLISPGKQGNDMFDSLVRELGLDKPELKISESSQSHDLKPKALEELCAPSKYGTLASSPPTNMYLLEEAGSPLASPEIWSDRLSPETHENAKV